jgi:hypothetical protein
MRWHVGCTQDSSERIGHSALAMRRFCNPSRGSP